MSNQYCGGLYEVGDKKFANKMLALIEATRTNSSIHWNYHDDVWSTVDVEAAGALNMRALFRLRAKQLRDTYDYLALYYSGGSDSWTVLDAFIRAGIMVDELIINWPLKATRGVGAVFSYKPDYTNLHPSNTLSEWDHFLEEDLKDIKKRFPKVIITISDWSEEASHRLDENALLITNPCMHHHAQQVISSNYRSDGEKKATDLGLTTAYIYGADRPTIQKIGRACYMFFDDRHTRVNVSLDSFGSTVEYFFWTPNMPILAINQARVLFNAFANKLFPMSLLDNFRTPRVRSMHELRKNIADFHDVSSRVSRPDYDFTRFQVDATSAILHNDRVEWCQNISEYRDSFKYWIDVVSAQFNLIDKKYLVFNHAGIYDGIKPMISKKYLIGKL